MLNRPYIVCRYFKVGSTAVADPGFQKEEEEEKIGEGGGGISLM